MRFEDIGNDMAIDFRRTKVYSLFLKKNMKILDKSACKYEMDYDILRMLQKNTYMVIFAGARNRVAGKEVYGRKKPKWRREK